MKKYILLSIFFILSVFAGCTTYDYNNYGVTAQSSADIPANSKLIQIQPMMYQENVLNILGQPDFIVNSNNAWNNVPVFNIFVGRYGIYYFYKGLGIVEFSTNPTTENMTVTHKLYNSTLQKVPITAEPDKTSK